MTWKRFEISKEDITQTRRYKKKARFLIDESVDPRIAILIRNLGYNAEHVSKIGLSGHSDSDIISYAKRKNRILLTHDPDFLDDRKFKPWDNPGIVVLPSAQNDKYNLLISVDIVVTIVGQFRELWRNTKISVSKEHIWSVRTFEKDTGQIVTSKYRFSNHNFEIWSNNE